MGLLEGAAILLAGMGLGRFWPARRKGPKTVKPRCGCGDELSFHDPSTGQCHALNTEPSYSKGGTYLGTKQIQCTCRRYTGPEPLTTYYAPELDA